MNRQNLFVGMAAALFALCGLTSNSRAQGYPSGGYVGSSPYGVTYCNPIYPYGNYPGFPAGQSPPWANYGYGYVAPSGPPPKYRADAYTPWQLQQYGLPPNPSMYAPITGPSSNYGPGGGYNK